MQLRQLNTREEHDIDLGARVFCGAPQYMLETFGRLPKEADGRRFMSYVPPGNTRDDILIYAAFEQAIAIGLVQVQQRYIHAHRVNIGLLLVASDHRRQGHGSTMLSQLSELSRTWAGVTRFAVSVLDSNAAGLAFWRRAGFRTLVQGFAEPGYQASLTVMERPTLQPPAASPPPASGAGRYSMPSQLQTHLVTKPTVALTSGNP